MMSQILKNKHQSPNSLGITQSFALHKTLSERFKAAHDVFGDGLVLLSSFGANSIILLQEMMESGLDIRILNVHIMLPKYDEQLAYRHKLEEEFNWTGRIHVFTAQNDNDKVVVTNNAIQSLGATAILSGIRHDQTQTRAGKEFAETKDNVDWLYPILDWPKHVADDYIKRIPLARQFPNWSPDLQTKGGAATDVKTECGIHENSAKEKYDRDLQRGRDI